MPEIDIFTSWKRRSGEWLSSHSQPRAKQYKFTLNGRTENQQESPIYYAFIYYYITI